MARRRRSVRARSQRNGANGRTRGWGVIARLDPQMVPRVLLGAVDGVEIVAVGALQLARDVLLSAVSGAANVGAEAVTATVSGARGMLSATTQMVGEVAGTAQGALRAAVDNARRSGRSAARSTVRRPAAKMTEASGARSTAVSSSETPRSRRRTRRLRLATRPARPSVAA